MTFWSRSRQSLWTKGETSGNFLRVVEIRQDCDGDALLVLAEPIIQVLYQRGSFSAQDVETTALLLATTLASARDISSSARSP